MRTSLIAGLAFASFVFGCASSMTAVPDRGNARSTPIQVAVDPSATPVDPEAIARRRTARGWARPGSATS
jgi:hypothetical protein